MAQQLFSLVIFYLIFKGLNLVINKVVVYLKGLKKDGGK